MSLPPKAWAIQVCNAARQGNKQRCTDMLTEKGYPISSVAVESRSILFFAISSGNADLVETLLTFGCNPNQLSPWKKLPLCMAAEGGFDDVLAVLTAGGADLNLTDGHSKSALDYLKERGDRSRLLLQLQESSGLVACRLGCGAVLQVILSGGILK